MKRYKYLFIITTVLIISILSTGCNYNGKATIQVTNVGELAAIIRIYIGFDQALTHLEPGEKEIYEFAWPGHKDQLVTYIRYPKDNSENQLYDTITIKDGDYLELEVDFNSVD